MKTILSILIIALVLGAQTGLAMPYMGGGQAGQNKAGPAKILKVETPRYTVHLAKEFRYERGSSLAFVDRSPMGVHFSYEAKPNWWGRVELSTFSEKSGNETLHYRRAHTDMIGWLDYKIPTEIPLKPYFCAGAGFFRETVVTHFMQNNSTTTSVPSLVYGAGGGLELVSGALSVAGELRFLGGELDPNPLASGGFRIGMRF